MKFFKWIFIRNPSLRPTLDDVIVAFSHLPKHETFEFIVGKEDDSESQTQVPKKRVDLAGQPLQRSVTMVFNNPEGPLHTVLPTKNHGSETDYFR